MIVESLHVPFPQCSMTPNRATQLLADWSMEQREGEGERKRIDRWWWCAHVVAAVAAVGGVGLQHRSEAKRTDRQRRDEPIGPTPLRQQQQQQPMQCADHRERGNSYGRPAHVSCSAWLPFPHLRRRLRHSLLQPLPLFPSRRVAPPPHSVIRPPRLVAVTHPPPLPLPLVSVLSRCPLPLSMTICSSCC